MYSKIFLIIALCFIVVRANPLPPGCTGEKNTNPLIIDEPLLVKTVKNGKLFTVPYDERIFYIAVVNGTAYGKFNIFFKKNFN